MNDRVEKLLQPVSPAQRCGPDLSYDPRLDRLEAILRGKPEVDIGSTRSPAEPPDWAQMLKESEEFLAASKHLRVAVLFACSALKVEGLPGFRDGLQLIRELIARFWNEVHPLLDPDDDNDPQQRLSILSALTAPRNSISGWLQIIDYLHSAPLCRPAGAPAITLDDVIAAAASGDLSRDAASLAAQFSSVPNEQLAATRATVAEAIDAAEAIDSTLGSILGERVTIGFDDLSSTLRRIDRALVSRTTEEPVAAAADTAAAHAVSGTAATAAPAISGVVRSRADVIRALDSICDYYRQVEPGSPVPYFLRRAQTLAGLSFVGAMQELNLASLDQLRALMGSSVDSDGTTPSST